jgi:23S rRNA pseudouridine2457 synthase
LNKSKKLLYILFNKPYGVLSNFVDPEGRPTLQGYIPIPDIYAAGRLDYDSEGALILTNDGPLISRVTQPDHHIPKTYLVMVLGIITDDALSEMERGVIIEGVKTKRCQAMRINDPGLVERDIPGTRKGPVSWVQVILREGRKRQVRRMTAAVGFPTLRLFRMAIGNITVEGLPPGEWRYLDQREVENLKTGTWTRA